MYVSNLVFLHSLYYFQAQILISFLCAGFPKFPSVINAIETNQSLIRFSGFRAPYVAYSFGRGTPSALNDR